MVTALSVVTIFCLLIPVYTYAGYPALLWLLTRILPDRRHRRGAIEAHVSMIVSCYNEVDVIGEKIENCLNLEYDRGDIEFIFVSDGSDDGTDEIIKRYSEFDIRLIRQEGRLGKTAGLNRAVPRASGSIIVFSDANAMYARDAITNLVRNFSDPKVGYVVGAALYGDAEKTAAGADENAYWSYELWIKELESRLHSVVGGDGAIYAIRKELYTELNPRDISDFVNPLQIVIQGFRGVFDAEARCFESAAGTYRKEGLRKERIVNRSIRGLLLNRSVMNPLKFGFFSFEVISHKLLRWLVPAFLLTALAGSTILSALGVALFQGLLAGAIVFLALALTGCLLSNWSRMPQLFSLPYYFVMVNFYALRGIWSFLMGKTQVTWTSSRAQQDSPEAVDRSLIVTLALLGLLFLTYRLYVDLTIVP